MFIEELKSAVQGDVIADAAGRGAYATDASHYQLMPQVIVVPRDVDDVVAALKIASAHRLPVTPRAGGTSLGGSAIGRGMILDTSKYMNQILEVNAEERWVRVQPGVVRDNLNAELAQHGLFFAPDPATTSRANIGGMIGNNSSGSRSIIYGKTVDHVLEATVVLPDGEVVRFSPLSREQYDQQAGSDDRKAGILRGIRDVVEQHRDEIAARYPRVMRNVMGYNLNELVDAEQWNLAKIVCGSEGTLGTLVEAKINLVELPKAVGMTVVHFHELMEAIGSVEPMVRHEPSAVEILGRDIIELVKVTPIVKDICGFIEGDPQALLIVEFYGDDEAQVRQKLGDFIADMQSRNVGYAYPVMRNKAERADVWQVRKSGLGIMLNRKGPAQPVAFIEDAAIPLPHLPEYIEKILARCTELDVPVAMYAHASVGLIHVRPIMNLRERSEVEKMVQIAEYSFSLVQQFGGALTGEHGDGMVRSPFVERFYGQPLYNAFREVKRLFDPQGIMNPGKVLDAEPMDQNLRFGSRYAVDNLKTEFHYLDQGSFAETVHACTGVGACRQTLAGTMCPSYRATRDEVHSTRGRANALRLAMSGQLPDGLANREVYQILDLCLSCKACKSECPSSVDVARLKSEFLQVYRDKHGIARRDKLIRDARTAAECFSGPLAPLVNTVQSTGWFRSLLEKVVGFDKRRTLPPYARRTLQSWFRRRGQSSERRNGKSVVLFDDTYVSFHEPHVGIAAVELLESCGYDVILAGAGCCQRPRISNGFLREARSDGSLTLRNLDRFIKRGLEIVVVEPSCASALVDDLPDLLGDRELRDRLQAHVKMIDVFLSEQVRSGQLQTRWHGLVDEVVLHGHCHQKAMFGIGAMQQIYQDCSDLECTVLNTGCCGMAGSFGYEKEHYDLSLQVAEDRLLPALKSCGQASTVVACGFSCRHQIDALSDKKALHWVETIRGDGTQT